MQYLTFKLNDVEFAIDVKIVETVVEYEDSTSIPTPLAYMRGVIDLRGQVIPLIDLRKKLGQPPRADEKGSNVIVFSVESGQRSLTVGALVDGVSEVVTLSEDAIDAASGETMAMWERYVKGIVRLESRMIVLLEPNGLFSLDEIDALRVA